ncbi:ComEC/Rec2 family competence protein [uncultured Ruminococcus sp.]|uniref:ComEC/Rec2 family competence protein n=1 Tax=uncultured Ruminococcus sp. TaxID=165186 RepID=UPI00292D6A86|nr:ComEC/Rec2 family competence protein [uncultured Ruminococcus sp.]
MKRLPAQIGITCFSVLSVAFFANETAVIALGIMGLAGAVAFSVIQKLRKTVFLPVIAITVALSAIFSLCYEHLSVKPIHDRYSGTRRVHAVLCDEPYKNYRMYYYHLKTLKIDDEDKSVDILLKTPKAINVEVDDAFRFTCELVPTNNDYYRAKGYLLMTDEYKADVQIEEAADHSLYFQAIRLRRVMRSAFDSLLPGDSAKLTRAILLGDKYAMDNDLRDQFRYAGASYFIVVSGMHFSVICMLLIRLLKRFKRLNRWVNLVLSLLLILLYMSVTGFQSSVMRSGLMMVMLIIGGTVRRKTYPLNHLGVAGILLPAFMSPYAAGDPGLILSFYATLSILLWAEPIRNKLSFHDGAGNIPQLSFRAVGLIFVKKSGFLLLLKLLLNSISGILSVSLAANILVVPISVCLFRELSPVTLLSSVILYPCVYLILFLALPICVLWCLPFLRWMASGLSWPLYFLTKLVLWAVGLLASVPGAYIPVHEPFVPICFFVNAVLMTAVLLLRRRYNLLLPAALTAFAVFLGGFLIHSAIELNTIELIVSDADGGMSVALNSRGNLHLLAMDCKSRDYYRIMNELSDRFGSAESALCLDKSEYERYLNYSDHEFAIHRYLLYDIEDEGEGSTIFSGDSDFVLDDGVTLSVSTADGQPVMLLRTPHKQVVLLPEGAAVSDIPLSWREADCIISGSQTALDSDHIKYTCEGGFTLDLR